MASPHVIDQTVRRSFPHPIAAAWHRASLASNDAERVKRLLFCLEVLCRCLTALVLNDYLRGERAPQVEELLTKLARPSLGHWVGLTREILRELKGREDPFMPEAISWYFTDRGKPTKSAKLLDELVTLRNQEAHGHAVSGAELSTRAAKLMGDMRSLMGSLSWLRGYRPMKVRTQRLRRRGGFRGELQWFVGIDAQPLPVTAKWDARLFADSFYLGNPAGDALLELSPWVQVLHDVGSRQEQVFLVSHTRKQKKLVLKNDATGNEESLLIPGDDEDLTVERFLEQRADVPFIASNREAGDLAVVDWHGATDAEVLDDRFEVRQNLGSGGMAEVFLIWDRWDEAEFALKVLHAQLSDESSFAERFKREARTMRSLRHPHILGVEESGKLQDGRIYLKLPLMGGGTLEERIKLGPVGGEQLTTWARQMLDALAYCHERGITHRDVKPSNFLLDDQNDLHLADFGIARREEDVRLTRALEQMGTMAYMSPEQMRGAEVGPKSDVFSLGMVLHELATGEERPTQPGKGMPALQDLVRRMCAAQPGDRPTAAQALAELAPQKKAVVPAPPPPLPTPTVTYHYAGPSGPEQGLSAEQVAQRIQQEPMAAHMVWTPVLGDWTNWTEVDDIAAHLEETTSPPPPPPELDSAPPVEPEPQPDPAFEPETETSPPPAPAEASASELLDIAPDEVRLTDAAVVLLTRGVQVQAHPALADCSWFDAVRGCNALSRAAGLQPCYTLSEPKPQKRLPLHDVLRRIGDFMTEDQKHTLLEWVQTEPGKGKKRKRRKVSPDVIARELVAMLQFEPDQVGELPGIGAATVANLREHWNPEEFYSVTVTWNRDANGFRLPTEAEWRLVAPHVEPVGPEWVWDLDPAARRRGRLPGLPPAGAHTDWFSDTGGPMRIVMEPVDNELKRWCYQPSERGRGIHFRAVINH